MSVRVFAQIDDAYLGSERNGGKADRGSENKRPFVLAVETDEACHPRRAVIEPVTDWLHHGRLGRVGAARTHPNAEVFSDGLGALRAVVPLDHSHTLLDTGAGRKATEAEGTRWVNILISNLKRALDGSYHGFKSFKYAHRYLPEAAVRSNRRLRFVALVPRLFVAVARCPAWPERKLCDVPVFAG